MVLETVFDRRDDGLTTRDRMVESARHAIAGVVGFAQPHLTNVSFGKSPLERDWDLLIVLDSCRTEGLRRVADEYDFLPQASDIDAVRSPASSSRTWIRNALSDEYAEQKRRTGLVAWNPFTDYECEADNWQLLDEVWRDTWDDDRGCLPPDVMTERGVEVNRTHDLDRLVVWYQQPHTPYRTIESDTIRHDDVDDMSAWKRRKVWHRVMDPTDDLTTEEVRRGYLDNLRWVLDHVEPLVARTDYDRPVLTADHGELLGEWLLYGHRDGVPLPKLVSVPWAKLEA